jgi:hypothetical protein
MITGAVAPPLGLKYACMGVFLKERFVAWVLEQPTNKNNDRKPIETILVIWFIISS